MNRNSALLRGSSGKAHGLLTERSWFDCHAPFYVAVRSRYAGGGYAHKPRAAAGTERPKHVTRIVSFSDLSTALYGVRMGRGPGRSLDTYCGGVVCSGDDPGRMYQCDSRVHPWPAWTPPVAQPPRGCCSIRYSFEELHPASRVSLAASCQDNAAGRSGTGNPLK